MNTKPTVTGTQAEVSVTRRPYSPPQLIVHGTAADLTQGGPGLGTGGSDIA
jgi:hypothetical protein